MRSILLSIIFCLVSNVGWSRPVVWNDLVENPGDGLVYNKFLTMPFTGVVAASVDDPVQRSYDDGSKHGEWVEFDSNGLAKSKSKFSYGRLTYKMHFKDGKKHGSVAEFNKNGQLMYRLHYKNGKEHGLQKRYHELGQLKYTSNYKDGKRHGIQERFDKMGLLISSTNYENGVKVQE